MLVSFMDLMMALRPTILSDAVPGMTLCGQLYAGYSGLIMIALPYTDNSSNVIDVILSFMISIQMLLTTSLGFADSLDAGIGGRTGSKLAARERWLLGAFVLGSAACRGAPGRSRAWARGRGAEGEGLRYAVEGCSRTGPRRT